MDISQRSDAWFPVRHHASKEWSEFLLFHACNTSVSGQIYLTELQLDPSFVMKHATYLTASSAFVPSGWHTQGPCLELHLLPHTLLWQWLGPNPWGHSQHQVRQSAAEAVCDHQINLSCLLQREGAGQMDVSRGTVWSTGSCLDYVASSNTCQSELRHEGWRHPKKNPAKQHRKVTYLTYSTILISTSKLQLWKKIYFGLTPD